MKFICIKSIGGYKEGKILDSFNGSVSGISIGNGNYVSFSNGEFFKLVKPINQEIIISLDLNTDIPIKTLLQMIRETLEGDLSSYGEYKLNYCQQR